MRLSLKWIIPAALVVAVLLTAAVAMLLRPSSALFTASAVEPSVISPNADGSDDVTMVSYSLSRAASVTILFEHMDGRQFVFREDEARTAGDYSVLFSGVVDGYLNDGETVQGEVLRRLMPDGDYTWQMIATESSGAQETATGLLTLTDGEPALPEIYEFTIFPEVFTPNQDGITDRTAINVGLSKPSELQVYLQREGMQPIFVPERLEVNDSNASMLRHLFDYEGGVDLGADPPPDGDYTVVALAQDAVGQRVQRTGTLTLLNGGKPFAQIVPQPSGATVIFEAQPYDEAYYTTAETRGALIGQPESPAGLSTNAITMNVGDMLVFQLTVENYSDIPIRTAGSPPGTVYDWTQRAATLGEFDQSGAWRVGIDCDTAASDYPWRWRLGTDEEILTVEDPDTGDTFYYLPAGARVVVWGAIRMTEVEARNPQNCWAGLIHEDVGISQLNASVGPRRIFLEDLSETAGDTN